MRILARLGILAACLLLPAIAAADSGWYLDGGLGMSHASERAPLIEQTPGPQSFTT
jgi:hypothetical protein